MRARLLTAAALIGLVGVGFGISYEYTSGGGSPKGVAAVTAAAVLPLPGAPVVRVMKGCVWGTGSKALQITRKIGQGINVVNLDSAAHRLEQAAGTQTSLPWWYLQTGEAVGFVWRTATTVVLTTCSGAVRLTVKVLSTTG